MRMTRVRRPTRKKITTSLLSSLVVSDSISLQLDLLLQRQLTTPTPVVQRESEETNYVGNTVHYYWHSSQQVRAVLAAPGVVISTAILPHTDAEKTTLVIALKDHTLWQISLSEIISCMGSTNRNVDLEKPNEEDDVFAGLLEGEGNSGTTSRNRTGCTHSEQTAQHTRLQSNHFVTCVEGLVDIASINSCVYALVIKNDLSHIFVYQRMKNGSGDNLQSLILTKEIPTGLGAELFADKCRAARLLYTVTLDKFPGSDVKDPSMIALSTSLFISIFGKDAALMNSPILLLASNKGIIFYYTVNTVSKTPAGYVGISVCCQLSTAVMNVGIVRIKCKRKSVDDPQQEIVSALRTALGDDLPVTDSEWISGLLVVSESGEGCMFLQPDLDIHPVLTWSIPHRVKSSVIVDGTLVCDDTGGSIVVCDFSLCIHDGHCTIEPTVRALLHNVNTLQLLPFPLEKMNSENGEPSATAVTKEGTQISICLKKKNHAAPTDSKCESIQGRLNNIRKHSQHVKTFKEKTLSTDSFLLQLNILSRLVNARKACAKDELRSKCKMFATEKKMINCTCGVSSKASGYETSWSLDVQVHNETSVSLGKDWAVLVTLTPLDNSLLSMTTRDCHTFCYPLYKGLEKNSSINLLFPLDKIIMVNMCPAFQVSVSLSLKLSEEDRISHAKLNRRRPSVQAEVVSCRIDILHFLLSTERVLLPPKKLSRAAKSVGRLNEEIEAMASKRQHSGCKVVEPQENISASVSVPVSNVPSLKTPTSILSSLLGNTEASTNCLSGQFITPAGVLVSLSVGQREVSQRLTTSAEANSGGGDGGRSGNGLVVSIVATDAETVFGLKEAIKQKLKILNISSPQETAPPEVCKLQGRLKELEDLRRQLIQFPVPSNDPDQWQGDSQSTVLSSLLKLCSDV